jgi:hypothetical protein
MKRSKMASKSRRTDFLMIFNTYENLSEIQENEFQLLKKYKDSANLW